MTGFVPVLVETARTRGGRRAGQATAAAAGLDTVSGSEGGETVSLPAAGTSIS